MGKYLYTFLILTLVSFGGFAQPVLTATGINPVIGDQYYVVLCDYVNPGSSGANQTWDLSGMDFQSVDSLRFGSVSSVPGGAAFLNAANLEGTSTGEYNFYHVSSSAFQYMGVTEAGGGGGTEEYGNPQDILHFPFSVGNTFTDTWSLTYVGSNISTNGTVTVKYDGYGTLKTPAGNFSNAVRVYSFTHIEEVDTSGVKAYTIDEYTWYQNGDRRPLADLNTLRYMGQSAQFGEYAVTGNTPTGIATNAAAAASQLLYPNPASGQVDITLGSSSVSAVMLFDQSGHLVRTQAFEGNSPGAPASMKLEGLANGVYLARIAAATGEIYTRKLTIVNR